MPEWAELPEKDWLKRTSDHQLPKRLRKKTLIVPQLLWQRQSLSLHTLHCQGTCKPSSSTTFMLNSHGGRAVTGKKVLCLCVRSLWSCPTLCSPVDSGLPGFSVRGALQARILECIGQYWLSYSSRALHFLLP